MVMRAIKVLIVILVGLLIVFAVKYGQTGECPTEVHGHEHVGCCGHTRS